MATVKISDGRTVLYQWDTGVIIELCDCRDFTECHFATDAGLIRREVTGSLCAVPDAALQRAGTLTVYAFARDENGGQTQHVLKINVLARPKPADYIDPPDEADYIDLIAERAAKALPLFIVHTEWVDGVLRADKLPWEIDAAADKGHACVMVYASNTLAYCGRKEKHPAFIGQPDKKTNGMFFVDVAYVLDDGTVDITPSSYIAAMTAKPLVFKGAVNATFTGTETTYVTIPDGSSDMLIVETERMDGVLYADKTPAEISEAMEAGRVCLLRYGDAALSFYGWRDGHPAFAGVPYKPNPEAHDAHAALDCVVLDDGTVEMSFYTIKGLTANPLVFEGGVEASYNGSKETRINISNVVNNALTEAKESGDFKGDPGTSVTITNITQSTEDDGYSVVTFSDGKTLRVKNGSKGSAGEGGEGGGVVTVYCQPSEDMQSFTASMTVEEIRTAVEEHKAVQSFVLGMDIVAHAFMVTEDVVLFSSVASFAGESMAVTLNMMADGTNAMTVTALGGMCVVNIATSDNGMTGTADMTGPQLFEAVSMGQPVYANFNGGMYAPAQLVDANAAAFKIELSGGTIMATIDDQGTVTLELAENSGAGGNVVAVTLAYEGNTIKPSHTSSEIYALIQAGNAVLLRYGAKTCTVIEVGEDKCVFEHMGYSVAGDQMTFGDYTTVTIAGDVVTLKDHMSQSSYPNPHPLVINGVRYDGRERVDVDVAGRPVPFALIEKITIEEGSNVKGYAYNKSLKDFLLTFEIPASVASNGGIEIYKGSDFAGYAYLGTFSSAKDVRIMTGSMDMRGGSVVWTVTSQYNSPSGNVQTNSFFLSTKRTDPNVPFTKISAYSSNPFPAGTVITLEGVMADA